MRAVHNHSGDIRDGNVGAPAKLAMVLPDLPTSDLLLELDGYLVWNLGI